MLKLIIDNTDEPLKLVPRAHETIDDLKTRVYMRLSQPHKYHEEPEPAAVDVSTEELADVVTYESLMAARRGETL